MNLRTPDYLEHIEASAADILAFISDLSRQQFRGDRRTQKAVIMSLVEIGEAATKIMQGDPEFVATHPEVPWRNMRGMRNRITHGYFDIDLDIVWDTATDAIPDLHRMIVTLLATTRSQPLKP